jgi:predicted  nucleic acid-binding Zn-ribbon protein
MVVLFIKLYFQREHLTMKELEEDNKKINKKVKKIEDEYNALQQKIDDQQQRMKSASDQASQAKSAITAAIHS